MNHVDGQPCTVLPKCNNTTCIYPHISHKHAHVVTFVKCDNFISQCVESTQSRVVNKWKLVLHHLSHFNNGWDGAEGYAQGPPLPIHLFGQKLCPKSQCIRDYNNPDSKFVSFIHTASLWLLEPRWEVYTLFAEPTCYLHSNVFSWS